MREKGKRAASKSEAKWKPISCEVNHEHSNADDMFEGLIEIEELCDYGDEHFVKNKKLKIEAIDTTNSDFALNLDALSQWTQFPISKPILKAIEELQFNAPTPIQTECIPIAINDRCDILGAAPTGSGKTLAFGIPLLEFLIADKQSDSSQRLRALVLVPTRELAVQVNNHLTAIAKFSNVSIATVIGGLSVQKQERILNNLKPDIVVATPGRLWELISESQCNHVNTKSVQKTNYIVVDEADRMTEKGHFEDLTPLINLLKRGKDDRKRQVFVFSATLTFVHKPPERQIHLKRKMTPKEKIKFLVKMLGMRENETKVIDLTDKGIGTPSDQLLAATKIDCLADEKDLYLYYLITVYNGRTLVFCNSKDCLRRLINVLKCLDVNPLSLHASMEQKRRLQNLEKFTANPNGVLVATDVAARGLDIANIDHVVHYQVPRTVEIYVHRSGRTARAANKGLTLMLCSPPEHYHYRKLCQVVNNGYELANFPIDDNVLKVVKNRVTLAQEVDKLEHKLRKGKAEDNWFKKAAKELDIELDDEDRPKHEDNESEKKLRALKKSLKLKLKQSLIPRSCYSSYLTKQGSFKLPVVKGKKAIDMIVDAGEEATPLSAPTMKRRKKHSKKKFKK
ncbi:ATP-dependent RNA helicase DDX24-like protein [Dinothrombium tinctorium]|uniref:ATP-dependent RNA helicase n=1 Tax=Dinothrombium tinctorium TaxID=1965070 RepID=A0A3S3PGC6_9ACAR|nr:ATP-dependent RNA helicase DDX24-like protein [Dinothrombium tinctorium]RWS11875.1 ATP-dependent RNA helicase DDX24-like protein [Dinothrombium tinctorium]RWS11880.1 ATP-dependent RNA helicase DDX24-like protein [Dinothrombium tinctorium]